MFTFDEWSVYMNSTVKAKLTQFVVGWNVVINDNDEIDFIERNRASDMDLLQDPLKKGVRREFERV